VDLPEGASGSGLLHQVLRDAVGRFPGLNVAGVPAGGPEFRSSLGEVVARFEAERVASPECCEIARHLAAAGQRSLVWRTADGEVPLPDAVVTAGSPRPIRSVRLPGRSRLAPIVPYRGRDVAGQDALRRLVHDLHDRALVTRGVVESLEWLLDHVLDDGRIDLSHRRIALLGAAAELAPTREWLAAGADVLWLDLVEPPTPLLEDQSLSGRLSWIEGGVDLLRGPAEVAATLLEYAQGGPLDLGLYAYAPGGGREWRLTGAMNAIVAALPAGAVRSVTALVSPTTPAVLGPGDLEAMERRRSHRSAWEAAADRLGLLGRGGGCVVRGDVHVTRSVVSIQGAGYQAAQYLGKVMAAEAWATATEPLIVSANVAPVSTTRSVQHPVFDLAFRGAESFDVETFAPATTRVLNGLLALRDWLDPDAPGAPTRAHEGGVRRAEALRSVRVHGALHTLPYPLEPGLRVAAAVGLVKNPLGLTALLRR
jgi:hypothetical protein